MERIIKYYNGEMYTIPKEFEAEVRADERKLLCDDLIRKCNYLLSSGTGKKKSLEHLIRFLEKKEGIG